MDFCPVCKRMSGEINHYTGRLICYNHSCGFKETEKGAKKRRSLGSSWMAAREEPILLLTNQVPIEGEDYAVPGTEV
ncbi:MAG: hypothetical protein GF387_02960 [Candidatus Portnoybacteria bacterium]|nr:hypothetical protein [Candidatus Portnoybacteria bacterium]